jgi:Zn-dependent protease
MKQNVEKGLSMNTGFRLGRIGGVDIFVDWSLFIIFFLVTSSLGAGVFPAWHPDWGAALIWATALTAAISFFVSVLLHELSHALVGRTQGI